MRLKGGWEYDKRRCFLFHSLYLSSIIRDFFVSCDWEVMLIARHRPSKAKPYRKHYHQHSNRRHHVFLRGCKYAGMDPSYFRSKAARIY